MNFERPASSNPENHIQPDTLVTGFRELSKEVSEPSVFHSLEEEIFNSGYELADNMSARQIFNDNSLFCRSEEFSKVMSLISENEAVTIDNPENTANMCAMMSAEGYRIAMTEGFSGREVNNAVKVVMSFHGNHLTSHSHLTPNDELWKLKPQTAAVSLSGTGKIAQSDIAMISFRFPVHLYPTDMLTEAEEDLLEEEGLPFIVRHYIPIKKVTH